MIIGLLSHLTMVPCLRAYLWAVAFGEKAQNGFLQMSDVSGTARASNTYIKLLLKLCYLGLGFCELLIF